MRVLHVSPSFAPAYRFGGPVRSLEGLLPALVARGAEVRVLTTDVAGPGRLKVPRGWTTRDGIPVRYCHSWTDRDLAPGLLVAGAPELAWADVVHVTGLFCSTSAWGVLAAARRGTPVVLSPRGALEAGSLAQKPARKRVALALSRPLVARVDVFHVTSDKERRSVEAVVRGARTFVVPNGTSLGDWSAPAATPPARIAALGRVHPSKGYLELVHATGMLVARGLDCALVIAGPEEDPAYAASLREAARECGVADRVQLVGELRGEAKDRFLREARVLALPSRDTENFGNAVIEALAAGRPVVASALTPWARLEQERCGRHVPNDAASLADALAAYVGDPALAGEAGRRGRALAEREYGWPRIAASMLDLYAAAQRARAERP